MVLTLIDKVLEAVRLLVEYKAYPFIVFDGVFFLIGFYILVSSLIYFVKMIFGKRIKGEIVDFSTSCKHGDIVDYAVYEYSVDGHSERKISQISGGHIGKKSILHFDKHGNLYEFRYFLFKFFVSLIWIGVVLYMVCLQTGVF